MHPVSTTSISDLRIFSKSLSTFTYTHHTHKLMRIDEVKDNRYYKLNPDRAYWSPTIQRLVTIIPNPDLIVKVTSHCTDLALPLVFGKLANIFPEHRPNDTEFELAFLAEDIVEQFWPEDNIARKFPVRFDNF